MAAQKLLMLRRHVADFPLAVREGMLRALGSQPPARSPVHHWLYPHPQPAFRFSSRRMQSLVGGTQHSSAAPPGMSTRSLGKGGPIGHSSTPSQTIQHPNLSSTLGGLTQPSKLHRALVSSRIESDSTPRTVAGPTRAGDAANGPIDKTDDANALPHKEKFLTLPTILTLFRVVLVPAIIPAFYASPSAAAGLFLLASITDWLDGYLARKMKTSSEFGAFLDPVADKLMVAAVLVLLCTEPHRYTALPEWVLPAPVIAIISREIAMSALREWAAGQGPALREVVAVSSLGKWKTATQLTALNLLLVARMALDPNILLFSFTVGLGFLYVASGLTVWSIVLYGLAIWRKLK